MIHNFPLFRMTKFDIKNYFERIYGLDIYKVTTRIQRGTLIMS